MYKAPAVIARASPIQKRTYGKSVPALVTIISVSDAYRIHVAAFPRKLTESS
jgi:hypothetical protein